jgi:hypothetical protein
MLRFSVVPGNLLDGVLHSEVLGWYCLFSGLFYSCCLAAWGNNIYISFAATAA